MAFALVLHVAVAVVSGPLLVLSGRAVVVFVSWSSSSLGRSSTARRGAGQGDHGRSR